MSRDLRRYARQTNFQLLIGVLLILFVVGSGLIYVFYGLGGLITGLLCMLGGLAPVVLIVLVLWAMDWLVKLSGQIRMKQGSGKKVVRGRVPSRAQLISRNFKLKPQQLQESIHE